MNVMNAWRLGVLIALGTLWQAPALAQSQFVGSLEDFTGIDVGATTDLVAGQMGKVGKFASWGLRTVRSSDELAEAYRGLDSGDDAYDPLGLDDGFQAPSACGDDPDCQVCYERAMERIDFNRYYLHRAWSITTQYSKFAEDAMAFGDSASGIHGVAGLGWQLQGRPPIKQSLADLHGTYRAKYADYIRGLESGLGDLAKCESDYAGDDRWFGRYAAMYIEMVKTKYKM